MSRGRLQLEQNLLEPTCQRAQSAAEDLRPERLCSVCGKQTYSKGNAKGGGQSRETEALSRGIPSRRGVLLCVVKGARLTVPLDQWAGPVLPPLKAAGLQVPE